MSDHVNSLEVRASGSSYLCVCEICTYGRESVGSIGLWFDWRYDKLLCLGALLVRGLISRMLNTFLLAVCAG